MPRPNNPQVRIYRPVYKVLKELAEEEGIVLSDLISVILFRVALENPSLLKVVLTEEFGIDYEDAYEIAETLGAKMLEEITRYESKGVKAIA